MPADVASVSERSSGMAEMAGARSLLAMPFLPSYFVRDVLGLVVVVFVVPVRVLPIGVVVAVVVGNFLVSALELINLLICAG